MVAPSNPKRTTAVWGARAARGARALHRRVRWLYDAWFVTHIAASILLVVLVAYHAVIAIAYE